MAYICCGITRKGLPCKKQVKAQYLYCYLHTQDINDIIMDIKKLKMNELKEEIDIENLVKDMEKLNVIDDVDYVLSKIKPVKNINYVKALTLSLLENGFSKEEVVNIWLSNI